MARIWYIFITYVTWHHLGGPSAIQRPQHNRNDSHPSKPLIKEGSTIGWLRPNKPINWDVLRRCKTFKSNSRKSNYLDTKSLESFVPNCFKTHFCIHGVLEIKISMINEKEIEAWTLRSQFSEFWWIALILAIN